MRMPYAAKVYPSNATKNQMYACLVFRCASPKLMAKIVNDCTDLNTLIGVVLLLN